MPRAFLVRSNQIKEETGVAAENSRSKFFFIECIVVN